MKEMFKIFNTLFAVLAGISILFIFTTLIKKLYYKYKNRPPGPIGLPIVGYFPFMTKKPHLKLEELGKKYGSVFSLQLGSRLALVLNDSRAIREAFSKPAFAGRPPQIATILANVRSPFFAAEGQKVWSDHKKLTLHTLKDLGLGKSEMHDRIQEEIQHLIPCIRAENGNQMSIKKLLTPSTSNNICSLMFGRRYDYKEEDRIFLDYALENLTKDLAQISVYAFFPWLMYPIIRRLTNVANSVSAYSIIRTFVRKQIDNHKETIDPSNLRDFIDRYLMEEWNLKNSLKDTSATLSEDLLGATVQNFFGAGSEPVRTTVEWCLFTLAAYPEVQSKVSKEINDIVGNLRLPNYSDMKNMPYTQAVLQEIQRWQTVVPINILRMTVDDVDVFGYSIPKGTIVIANLWSAHHDPKCWEKPYQFIPERFLSPDGKTVIKNENYIPFSCGKRGCPGVSLATLQVFLYVTNILQQFVIKVPEGETVDFDGELTVSYHLKPQKLCFISRN